MKEALQSMGPDCSLFTVEELCKLRRSTTEREIQPRTLLVLFYILGVCLWKESMGIGEVQ